MAEATEKSVRSKRKRGRPPGRKGLTEEQRQARREYQRKYYQKHKAKAQEYQRLYNLMHKKKMRPRSSVSFIMPRQAQKITFHTCDIMGAPTEKAERMLNQILRGERFLTA